MAHEEQLQIISEDGVDAWNAWRLQNPDVDTDLSEAELQNTYLQKANLNNTNLRNTVLHGADLTGAIFKGANLTGANLEGANLHNAGLSGANLVNASLRDARLSGTRFDGAQFTVGTLGIGRLSKEQRASMTLVDVEPQPEDASEEPDPRTSDNTATLTVGNARSIVEPAHSVLQGLAIPNDLTEEHRNLFSELVRTVAELRQSLADLEEEDRLLSEENTGVGDRIDKALPIWKQTWLTFVASAGGAWVGTAAGSTGSIAAAYTAGFIAGVLHDTFSPGVSCIT